MDSQIRAKQNFPYGKIKSAVKNVLILLLVIALMLIFYKCPFKMITGIDCPGCGLTRAFFCILLCDFSAAVQYYPLSPLIFSELVYLLYYQFILRRKINNTAVAVGIAVNVFVMLAFWLYKIF